jgi:hypothetical protein
MMEMNSQYQDEETGPVLSSVIYKRLYDISIITYYLMKDVKKEMTMEMHSKIVELFFDHILTQRVIGDSEQPILSTDKRTLISSIFNALKLEESSGKIHYPVLSTASGSTNETSQQQKPATLKEVSFEVRFAKFVTLCNGLQDGKKVENRFNDANEGKDTVFMEDALLIDPIIQMIKKEDFSQLTSEQIEIIRKLESKGFLPYSKNQTVPQSSSETNSNMESQLKPIIMRRKNKRKQSTEYEEKWFKRFDQLVQYALDHENCDIPEDYQTNSGTDDDHNNNDAENFKLGEWLQQERSKMENYFYYDYEKYYLLHNVFFPGVEIEKPEDFERELRNKNNTTTAQTSSSSSSLPSRGGRGKVVTTTTRDKNSETSSVPESLSEPKRKLTANKAPQRKSGGAMTTTQSSSLPMKQKENLPPQTIAEPKESSTVSNHLKNVTRRAEKHSYDKNHEETTEIDDKEEEYQEQEENSDEDEIILEDGEVEEEEEEEEEDDDYDDDVEIVVNKASKRNNKTNSTSNNATNTPGAEKRRKLSHNADVSNQSLTSNNFCLYEYKRKGESFLGLGKKITPSLQSNGEVTSSSTAAEFFEFRIFFPLTAKNPLSSKFEELEKTNIKIPRESIHQDSLAFNKG